VACSRRSLALVAHKAPPPQCGGARPSDATLRASFPDYNASTTKFFQARQIDAAAFPLF